MQGNLFKAPAWFNKTIDIWRQCIDNVLQEEVSWYNFQYQYCVPPLVLQGHFRQKQGSGDHLPATIQLPLDWLYKLPHLPKPQVSWSAGPGVRWAGAGGLRRGGAQNQTLLGQKGHQVGGAGGGVQELKRRDGLRTAYNRNRWMECKDATDYRAITSNVTRLLH